jgi:hypothetical protein
MHTAPRATPGKVSLLHDQAKSVSPEPKMDILESPQVEYVTRTDLTDSDWLRTSTGSHLHVMRCMWFLRQSISIGTGGSSTAEPNAAVPAEGSVSCERVIVPPRRRNPLLRVSDVGLYFAASFPSLSVGTVLK